MIIFIFLVLLLVKILPMCYRLLPTQLAWTQELKMGYFRGCCWLAKEMVMICCHWSA